MIRDESIIYISSIDWESKWQGHQEIASALATAGNNVLFIENTGVRNPALRDAGRIARRVRNWRRGRAGLRQERERLIVCAPLLLPFPYSRIALRLNGLRLVRICHEWMDRVRCRRPILLTFLPTPLVVHLMRALHPELTMYYCVDDFASSSAGARPIRSSEATLFREADLTFVTSERLRARAIRFRDEVHVLPAGVGFARFERARTSETSPPPELGGYRGPVVGYVGGLNQKTDEALLADVAGRLPDVQFVVMGPVQKRPASVVACPNVHLLGHRPHADIPAYLKGFDAGIIPYRVTEYTSHVYPAKLNEYLAMGLPVVATPLPEIRRFNETHGGVITVADGPEAFAAAVRQAVGETSLVDKRRRIAVAHANRWELKIATITRLVSRMLAERRRQPDPAALRTATDVRLRA